MIRLGKSWAGFWNTTSLADTLVDVNVASAWPEGFATYSSPLAPSRMIRNSHSVVLPLFTVRETPIIVPPSGAIQFSATCLVVRVYSQQPPIHATSLAVGADAWNAAAAIVNNIRLSPIIPSSLARMSRGVLEKNDKERAHGQSQRL